MQCDTRQPTSALINSSGSAGLAAISLPFSPTKNTYVLQCATRGNESALAARNQTARRKSCVHERPHDLDVHSHRLICAAPRVVSEQRPKVDRSVLPAHDPLNPSVTHPHPVKLKTQRWLSVTYINWAVAIRRGRSMHHLFRNTKERSCAKAGQFVHSDASQRPTRCTSLSDSEVVPAL